MSEQSAQTLVPFAQSVQGVSHRERGVVREDAAGKRVITNRLGAWQYTVFAVADGHGDSACARSNIGSQKAVDVTLDMLASIGDYLAGHNDAAERLAGYHDMKADLKLGDKLLGQLANEIVGRWRNEIKKDLAERPLDEREQEAVLRHGESWAKRAEHIYGTTLAAGLVTPTMVLLLQQGDGCCVAIGQDAGEPYWRPVPEDPRCVGNVTSSLSDEDAEQSVRFAVIDRRRNDPVSVLVGTDGVDKSMAEEGDAYFLRKVTLEVLDKRRQGHRDLSYMLESWMKSELDSLSSLGAGDDTSAAGYINIDLALVSKENIERDMEAFMTSTRLSDLTSRFTSMQRRAANIRQREAKGENLRENDLQYLQDYDAIREQLKELGGDPEAIEKAASTPAPTLAQINAMGEAEEPDTAVRRVAVVPSPDTQAAARANQRQGRGAGGMQAGPVPSRPAGQVPAGAQAAGQPYQAAPEDGRRAQQPQGAMPARENAQPGAAGQAPAYGQQQAERPDQARGQQRQGGRPNQARAQQPQAGQRTPAQQTPRQGASSGQQARQGAQRRSDEPFRDPEDAHTQSHTEKASPTGSSTTTTGSSGGNRSRLILALALAGVLLLGVGVGIYLYTSGFFNQEPQEQEESTKTGQDGQEADDKGDDRRTGVEVSGDTDTDKTVEQPDYTQVIEAYRVESGDPDAEMVDDDSYTGELAQDVEPRIGLTYDTFGYGDFVWGECDINQDDAPELVIAFDGEETGRRIVDVWTTDASGEQKRFGDLSGDGSAPEQGWIWDGLYLTSDNRIVERWVGDAQDSDDVDDTQTSSEEYDTPSDNETIVSDAIVNSFAETTGGVADEGVSAQSFLVVVHTYGNDGQSSTTHKLTMRGNSNRSIKKLESLGLNADGTPMASMNIDYHSLGEYAYDRSEDSSTGVTTTTTITTTETDTSTTTDDDFEDPTDEDDSNPSDTTDENTPDDTHGTTQGTRSTERRTDEGYSPQQSPADSGDEEDDHGAY